MGSRTMGSNEPVEAVPVEQQCTEVERIPKLESSGVVAAVVAVGYCTSKREKESALKLRSGERRWVEMVGSIRSREDRADMLSILPFLLSPLCLPPLHSCDSLHFNPRRPLLSDPSPEEEEALGLTSASSRTTRRPPLANPTARASSRSPRSPSHPLSRFAQRRERWTAKTPKQ